MRWSINLISYRAYRACSFAAAGLFLGLVPFIFLSGRLLKNDKFVLASMIVYVVLLAVIVPVNRFAQCPTCGRLLSPLAPFRPKCSKCGAQLETVRI